MNIVTTPNSVLIQPSQPVGKIDKKILDSIEEMKKTLLSADKPKGVGLAAPQIGKPLRIFITKPFPKSEITIFINPEIIWQAKEMTNGVPERDNKLEGCLSIPKIWGIVKRSISLKLKYQTPDTKIHTKVFSGFMATIIQHEMDHLDGRLFSSRVLEQKGKFYKTTKDEDGKEILEEYKLT
ncbi:MAG: peptide deformylase [Candidatus Gottesmanbacteria bacterium]